MAATKWTPAHEKAAFLVAEDRMTDRKIAEEVGISRPQLSVWKRRPDFQAKVRTYCQEFCDIVKKTGIGCVENRVNMLGDLERRYKQVILARAERYEEQWEKAEQDRTPAAEMIGALADDKKPKTPFPMEEALTGLVVYREVPTKNGVIKEWVVDTAPASEIRALHQQVAKELGQWTERSQIEVRDTSAHESLKRKLLKKSGAGNDTAVSGSVAGG